MDALELVNLTQLMEISDGSPDIVIGIIDGPIDLDHKDLTLSKIRKFPGKYNAACGQKTSSACKHGTSVAGILSGRRNSQSPAICPGCILLVRPVFIENRTDPKVAPDTSYEELTNAVIDCIHAGAHIINISAGPARPSATAKGNIKEALDYACRKGVLVVAAAGNQNTLGASDITRHKWVITVGACDNTGKPLGFSNLGTSIAINGLIAPGNDVRTLAPGGTSSTFSGTSAAAPFVTGTAALLWSVFPKTNAGSIRQALVPLLNQRRRTVVPNLLDAMSAYKTLNSYNHKNMVYNQ